MKKLIAEGYCGEQHTFEELLKCKVCCEAAKVKTEQEFKALQNFQHVIVEDKK